MKRFAPLLFLVAFSVLGCSKTPPPLTPVEGTILLDGKPLPHATVQFWPITSDFGPELNSTGITDDQGHFTLTCTRGNAPGAVVGQHKVVIMEGPVPGEIRRNQEKVVEFQNKLKNRPIPPIYGTFSDTTLTVEVTTGQKDYSLKLKSR